MLALSRGPAESQELPRIRTSTSNVQCELFVFLGLHINSYIACISQCGPREEDYLSPSQEQHTVLYKGLIKLSRCRGCAWPKGMGEKALVLSGIATAQ